MGIYTEGKELLEEWHEKGQPLGNFLDWLNYSVQIWAIVKWVTLITQVSAFSFELDYMMYDMDAVGRPMAPDTNMGEYQDMLEEMLVIVETRKAYFNLICISLLLTPLQLLKNLDFHPQMGIGTRPLSGAKADLTFFVLLYSAVNVMYAFLGVLLFGQVSTKFNKLGQSFLSNM